jgi:oligopeptide/dipeptide ABC transporter ATP-binding protein
MTTAPILEVDDLSVAFDLSAGPALALSHVSLRVGPGEILGLVGESGCGKSLTGLAVMGLMPGNAKVVGGGIRLEGEELVGRAPRELRRLRGRRVSMIFQEPMVALNPLMRVGRQIAEVLAIHRIDGREERRRRAISLLGEVGLSDPETRARQYPHELSGGMRQRVMIAMAIAAEPSLIIADEPTTALDTTVQAQILDMLLEIRQRLSTAILLITHDMGVVAEVADRVTVMYAGHVVETAPVVDLFAGPRHPYTDRLLVSIPSSPANLAAVDGADLPTIAGQVPALGQIPTGCPFAPRCPRAADICGEQRPRLEDGGPDHPVACFFPLDPPLRAAKVPPEADSTLDVEAPSSVGPVTR